MTPRPNVRSGSKTEVCPLARHVRSTLDSGHRQAAPACPFRAKPRHRELGGDLVGKRDGGDLGRAPPQQRREPGPMPGAMDLGVADDGECTSHEQAP